MMMMTQYINCVVKDITKCKISAVYNQRSGKEQISDVSDVNMSSILIKF